MKNNFTIDEILGAINDLHQNRKERKNKLSKEKIKDLNSDIPQNTLRLIEEAEKKINN